MMLTGSPSRKSDAHSPMALKRRNTANPAIPLESVGSLSLYSAIHSPSIRHKFTFHSPGLGSAGKKALASFQGRLLFNCTQLFDPGVMDSNTSHLTVAGSPRSTWQPVQSWARVFAPWSDSLPITIALRSGKRELSVSRTLGAKSCRTVNRPTSATMGITNNTDTIHNTTPTSWRALGTRRTLT